MSATTLSPLPIQHFVDNNGNALTGGKLFTYFAGTTSKIATYTDSAGFTPNPNPVILDTRGEAQVWLHPNIAYKFVLAPATDSDPPSNPLWTVDDIQLDLGTTIINCTATGTNAITLTPQLVILTPVGYSNYQYFGFTAVNNSTAAVTLQVAPNDFLPVYVESTGGATQAGNGDIIDGVFYIIVYNSILNLGTGGFQILAPTFLSLGSTGVTPGTYTDATVTVQADGRITVASSGSGGAGTPWPATTNQIVVATGTVTIPTGATRAHVRMVGGGGGGGGYNGFNGFNGGPGGAGAFAEQWFSSLTPGNTIAATVGAAGSAGVSQSSNVGTAGGAGGQTKLISGTQTITTMSANGGNGGVNGQALAQGNAGAIQSTTAGSAISIAGQGGMACQSGAVPLYTQGGSSSLGTGGFSSLQATGQPYPDTAPTGYGAGGAGGYDTVNGGAGAIGVIFIEWYS